MDWIRCLLTFSYGGWCSTLVTHDSPSSSNQLVGGSCVPARAFVFWTLKARANSLVAQRKEQHIKPSTQLTQSRVRQRTTPTSRRLKCDIYSILSGSRRKDAPGLSARIEPLSLSVSPALFPSLFLSICLHWRWLPARQQLLSISISLFATASSPSPFSRLLINNKLGTVC